MKRIVTAVAIIVACLGVLIFLASNRRERPRFITGDLPAYAPYKYLHVIGPRPQIAKDKLWLSTWSSTNDFRSFLFDIPQRRILGQLVNAAPLALNSNATKVLCLQREFHRPGLLHEARSIFSELVLRKGRPALDFEVVWMLDLRDNSAVKLGRVPRQPDSGSLAVPSPDFHHVLLRSAGGGNPGTDVYLCDLETKTLTKIAPGGLTGWHFAWWNERQILILAGGGYDVYDIYTQQLSPLLTEAQIATGDTRFYIPRGQATELYLAHPQDDDEEAYTRLIKVDRTNGTLNLASRKFNRNWVGELDPTDHYFVFTKRGIGGLHGLYLHDFQTDEVRILVPPDGTPVWYRPFFHGDKALYVRSSALWQIDMQGSNNVLLFPPTTPPN